MNRQIYGFTLFVFIVKSTFLIYWFFLAPVNFVKILKIDAEQNTVVENADPLPQLKSPVQIESAEINLQRQSIIAHIIIDNSGERQFSAPVKARLSIINENSQSVWQGETELRFFSTCASNIPDDFVPPMFATFEKTSKDIAAFDLKHNYRAQIQILSEDKSHLSEALYQPSDLQNVLLAFRKK